MRINMKWLRHPALLAPLFVALAAGTACSSAPAKETAEIAKTSKMEESSKTAETAETAKTPESTKNEKIPIRVLILPKFEVGEMSGDFAGEAQLYYEKYLGEGVAEYTVRGVNESSRLYVKDGVALYLLGMGKVQAALNTWAVLSDERFDFSNAYILSTGCSGSAAGSTVMGDVCLVTAAVDYDLGHHADSRELENPASLSWFRDSDFDDEAVRRLNPELMDRVWSIIQNVPVHTTEKTRAYMRQAFPGEEWADRDPGILRGTTITSDNYWKGKYDHENCIAAVKSYGCADPFAVSEMEEIGVFKAAEKAGILDRVISLRDSVNMDVFVHGATPESLWAEKSGSAELASEDSAESADIFETAMENNFAVGDVIIRAILDGKL